jgi:hypothetical protein
MDLKQLHKPNLIFFVCRYAQTDEVITLQHLSGNLLKLLLTLQKNSTLFSKTRLFFSPRGTSLFHRKYVCVCVCVCVWIFCTNTINKPCLYVYTDKV